MSRILSTYLMLLVVAGCGDRQGSAAVAELTGSAMGTSFTVKMVAPPRNLDHESLRSEITRILESVESQMSTYIADSELSRFNAHRGAEWFEVSPELCALVAEALSISAATDGAFDVTVGPLVNLWGFGPGDSIGTPPEAKRIEALLDRVGSDAVHIDCAVPALRKDVPGIYVDLSALAKGYGVDRLADALDAHGVVNYLVEVGGELRVRGSNAEDRDWAIAIESPNRERLRVQLIARVSDAGVATSGDYRNYFEHAGRLYSHTIDPRTGYPVTHEAASVTVVADTAAYADAMATALLVLGPDSGFEYAEQGSIAALFLVREDGRIVDHATRRFAAEVSYQ